MAITPYYASLIQRFDNTDPIFNMAVPQALELIRPQFIDADPLHEDCHSPVPNLIRKYNDRVLILSTSMCAMYCRHCTRKRIVGEAESFISQEQLHDVITYLKHNPEIKEVIVSGGDVLTLSTDIIDRILTELQSLPTIEVIRIGTRVPVTLPMRITDELVSMLKTHHPLWLNTHFNHVNEVTDASIMACTKLADAGIALGNQTVLLHRVNDSVDAIESLCRALIRMRVRPYYLYQCDPVFGVEHFRTPIQVGIDIIKSLRCRISGIAVPTFVVDGKLGKIPVLPNTVLSMTASESRLCNYDGDTVTYPEPIMK
jgi:lysine 2,3-aminomutase